jgi:hypothetical protein
MKSRLVIVCFEIFCYDFLTYIGTLGNFFFFTKFFVPKSVFPKTKRHEIFKKTRQGEVYQ